MASAGGAEVAPGPTAGGMTSAETAPEQNAISGGAALMEEVHVELDRSKYVKKVVVQALRVPKGACHQLVKKLSK